MRHLVYSVRYYLVQVKSPLTNVTLYSLVNTTLAYNLHKIFCPFHDVTSRFDSIFFRICVLGTVSMNNAVSLCDTMYYTNLSNMSAYNWCRLWAGIV
jgi:hypothetical protein